MLLNFLHGIASSTDVCSWSNRVASVAVGGVDVAMDGSAVGMVAGTFFAFQLHAIFAEPHDRGNRDNESIWVNRAITAAGFVIPTIAGGVLGAITGMAIEIINSPC